jgi:hypothetical protein
MHPRSTPSPRVVATLSESQEKGEDDLDGHGGGPRRSAAQAGGGAHVAVHVPGRWGPRGGHTPRTSSVATRGGGAADGPAAWKEGGGGSALSFHDASVVRLRGSLGGANAWLAAAALDDELRAARATTRAPPSSQNLSTLNFPPPCPGAGGEAVVHLTPLCIQLAERVRIPHAWPIVVLHRARLAVWRCNRARRQRHPSTHEASSHCTRTRATRTKSEGRRSARSRRKGNRTKADKGSNPTLPRGARFFWRSSEPARQRRCGAPTKWDGTNLFADRGHGARQEP